MSEQDRINLYTDGAYTLSGKTDIGEKNAIYNERSFKKNAMVACYKRTLTSIKNQGDLV